MSESKFEMNYNDFKKFTYATTFEAAYRLGEIAVEHKDYDGAILRFSEAIEFKPDSIPAYARKLLCLYALNRYEACISVAKKLIELEPREPRNYVTIAVCYYDCKKYSEAKEYFTIALNLNPSDCAVYLQRGDSNFYLKDYHAAFFDYSKCIELEPRLTSIYHLRARTRALLKDYKGAIEDYLKYLSADIDNGRVIFELGCTYLHDKQYEKGKETLLKAERLGIVEATKVLHGGKEETL